MARDGVREGNGLAIFGWVVLVVLGTLGAAVLLVGWQVSRALDGGLFGPTTTEAPGPPLDLAVAPTTGLRDDGTVLVSVGGAEPRTGVMITTCLAEVTTLSIESHCHEAGGATYETTDDGTFDIALPVRRVITTGAAGVVDCAAAPGRCAVLAEAVPLMATPLAEDRPRSGQRSISFAADLAPVELVAEDDPPLTDLLPVTLSPEGPLVDGAEVTVTASGFAPGETLAIGLCSDDAWDDGYFIASCDGLSRNVYDSRAPGPEAVADGTGAVTYRTPVPVELDPVLGGDEVVDCAERAGRCAIVVAAEADLQRSAYAPLTMVAGR